MPSFPAVLDLDGLNGRNGFRIESTSLDPWHVVAGVGDLNHDGFDDIVLSVNGPGLPALDGDVVVSGKAVVKHGASISASDLEQDAVLHTGGTAFAAAGDVNDDGVDDFMFGARDDAFTMGVSTVAFGSKEGFDHVTSFTFYGLNIGDNAGWSIAGVGDVDDDGIDDIIIGAAGADPGDHGAAGSSYVVFGHEGGFAAGFALDQIARGNGFRIDGIAVGDESGAAVAGDGDVNGDGVADIIVGAPFVGTKDNGAAYVVFGDKDGFDPVLALSHLDGSNGFRLLGAPGDEAGTNVAGGGDVNGDGIDDVIVTTSRFDAAAGGNTSTSYVLFGHRDEGFAKTISLAKLDGHDGFRIASGLGSSSVATGDVNADGIDDVIVSGGVVFGHKGAFATRTNVAGLDGSDGFRFARPVATVSVGDVNHDGIDDVIAGNGNAYVVFGHKGSPSGTAQSDHLVGTARADVLNGLGGSDVLDGNNGNDTLNGGAGADVMRGGAGNDSYVVDNARDKVVEAVDGGRDLVKSTVSFALAANVEDLLLTGKAAIDGTGNRAANVITGNNAANHLAGGAGADRLDGGLGRDVLTGGAGHDSFVFDSRLGGANIDRIADFAHGDHVELSHLVFTGIGKHGALKDALFSSDGQAHDRNDHILYNAKSGAVSYDADGSGAGHAVKFATVAPGLDLHAADFLVG